MAFQLGKLPAFTLQEPAAHLVATSTTKPSDAPAPTQLPLPHVDGSSTPAPDDGEAPPPAPPSGGGATSPRSSAVSLLGLNLQVAARQHQADDWLQL
eukprot:COSAG01_NODE_1987_length_8707_cov_2.906366_9_plen_97_part_00